MAYTVAQASVDVVPDARGFGEKLRAQVTPDAERVGRDVGDKIVAGIRERLLVSRPDVRIGADTTEASAKVDAFLAETRVKSAIAGQQAGRQLGDNMANEAGRQFNARGALMASAIGLGLIAGAPLLVGAAGVLFGGLAAAIVHNNEDITRAATQLGRDVGDAYKAVGEQAVPELTRALDQVRVAAVDMAPAVGEIFSNLGPAISGVTQGVIQLTQNVLPGLSAAVRNGTPVFAGLQSLLASIGSGLGTFFSTVSAHGEAMGTTLSSLGRVLDQVFRALGTVAGAGAELGSMVLPALAGALRIIADVLGVIGPILPGIALGFLAFKTVGLLTPLLASFAAQMETIGARAMVTVAGLTGVEAAGLAAGTGFGAAAAGARGLEAAMGPIGWILAGISVVVPLLIGHFNQQSKAQEQVTSSARSMTQALQASKGAIDDNVRAQAALEAQKDHLFLWANRWKVSTSTVVDALLGNKSAMEAVNAASEVYAGQQRNNAEATDKTTQAGQNSAIAFQALARGSADAAGSIASLGGTVQGEVRNQTDLQKAIEGSTSAAELNRQRLQGLANAADAGNTAIGLLKAGLDALSGKAVSLGDAEVAVTNAVEAAKTALEGQKDAAGNLTSALTDANGHLDKHTAAGAAAWQSLTQLKDASNTLISTMEQQGATTDAVTKRDGELRASFIQTARNMGFSAGEAENLANQIYGIPSERHTEITADTAEATRKAQALKDLIDAIKSKTVQVGVNYHVAGLNGGPGGTQLAGAIGGIVHAYAGGGIEPMQGGIAQIVAPQTYRLIGDRITDDEAYIPINDSARSLEILSQTANRMNYDLVPANRSSVDGASSQRGSTSVPALHVDRYYEASGSSARETAEELSWMWRTRQ